MAGGTGGVGGGDAMGTPTLPVMPEIRQRLTVAMQVPGTLAPTLGSVVREAIGGVVDLADIEVPRVVFEHCADFNSAG